MVRYFALLLTLIIGPTALADVGLVHKCFDSDATSKGTGSGLPTCQVRGWVRPQANDAILSCLEPTNPSAPNQCQWGSADARYRTWEEIPETAIIQTCSLDVPVGPFPNPPTDPCGSVAAQKPWLAKPQVVVPSSVPVRPKVVTWEPPNQFIDGSPLNPMTDLSGYRVEVGLAETGPFPIQVNVQGGTSMTVSIDHEEGLEPGRTYFFRAFAIGASGDESDPSNVVSADTQALRVPVDPGPLEVRGELLYAYTIVQTRNRLTLVPVGTLSPDTPCSGAGVTDDEGLTAYRVPYESVMWAGSVRSEVVLAECGAP